MTIKKILIVLFLLLLSQTAHTAEINVVAGLDTLTNAMANPTDGDVLLLQDGIYTSSSTTNYFPPTSLTIKSASRSYNPVIAFALTVNPGLKSVVLQGLTFESAMQIYSGSTVQILENKFNNSVDISNYQTSQGDGELYIIGNRFLADGGSITGNIYSDGAYIAGNIFEHEQQLLFYTNGWVVGNEFINNLYYAISINTISPVRIIGNRITVNSNTFSPIQSSYGNVGSTISNNIIQLLATEGNPYDGISSASSTLGQISNNVVVRKDSNGSVVSSTSGIAIALGSNNSVFGNIGIGFDYLKFRTYSTVAIKT